MVVQRKQCTILTPGVSVEVTPTAGYLFYHNSYKYDPQ